MKKYKQNTLSFSIETQGMLGPFIAVQAPDGNDDIRSYNMPKEFFVNGIEKEDCMENTWKILDETLIPEIIKSLQELGMTHTIE
jgi:hypothetical protein